MTSIKECINDAMANIRMDLYADIRNDENFLTDEAGDAAVHYLRVFSTELIKKLFPKEDNNENNS